MLEQIAFSRIIAKKSEFKAIIAPKINALEATMVNEIDVYGFNKITVVIEMLSGNSDFG